MNVNIGDIFETCLMGEEITKVKQTNKYLVIKKIYNDDRYECKVLQANISNRYYDVGDIRIIELRSFSFPNFRKIKGDKCKLCLCCK